MKMKMKKEKQNLIKITKEIKKEIKLWKNLRDYVMKRMVGKTFTKDLEKEINYMLNERMTYLSNLLKS